ncbi:Tle cognate immunity protein 4 C-terminal domain-containing protein [Cupriavidus oxalaticus]|uniref:T6SS immunity protein Tli4 family protein n=1 Tax=Cupriavidus oxalaticus TaxID=96344 RepID=UPI003F74114F
MKEGWRTRAIGRHLVDVPEDARLIESYKYNRVKIEPLPDVRSREAFDRLIALREQTLRSSKHAKHGSMFIERVPHANGSATLISWDDPELEIFYQFETYFRAGSVFLRYAGEVSPSLRESALSVVERLSREWREIPSGEVPAGIGYVADKAILAGAKLNFESWEMVIRLSGKPDVSLVITSYVQRSVEPGLRKRAGGILAGLLGAVAGVVQLRNRSRPVGPIDADEILVAGTQDGKRTYGFKWEAPGKADSLAEPNLNVSLQVGESAYPTNKESFASDEEALELWDAVVSSLRLRPGAV